MITNACDKKNLKKLKKMFKKIINEKKEEEGTKKRNTRRTD